MRKPKHFPPLLIAMHSHGPDILFNDLYSDVRSENKTEHWLTFNPNMKTVEPLKTEAKDSPICKDDAFLPPKDSHHFQRQKSSFSSFFTSNINATHVIGCYGNLDARAWC